MKPLIGILAVSALVYRAWARRSLTLLGLVVAGVSATMHALHPWSTPFLLLAVFYYGGTKATKVKHDVKARLTLSATGADGGEGPRNHIQVLANSLVATVLSIAHAAVLAKNPADSCFSFGQSAADILMVGIVAYGAHFPFNYAAVASDTFSSELGILSKSKPRLITSLTLREVPPGTNGGVTATGLAAGLLGSFTIALTSAIFLPFCSDSSGIRDRVIWTVALSSWGLLGSVLDSLLGGLLQASVVDKRSGKVVEGSGGRKVNLDIVSRVACSPTCKLLTVTQVLIHPGSTKPAVASGLTSSAVTSSTHLRETESVANAATLRGSRATGTSVGSQPGRAHDESHESRRVETGHDWLDNNGVNMLMAVSMSVGAMAIAQWVWGIELRELWA
ncbi:hypothetical protein N7532_005218 [Penicillium argentinense]|uniref:Uncharacterized protein n=1 Tax=Penicillium argentinense TaxID=1131581 RepID=A0A9W9FDK8_9EURO|nr:uncharacterized protein N7532_005218 [Penicillium argentinense]KAJ5098217.1 hypothetical protein N7532_005218 [Penicillium argentinense]